MANNKIGILGSGQASKILVAGFLKLGYDTIPSAKFVKVFNPAGRKDATRPFRGTGIMFKCGSKQEAKQESSCTCY